MIRIVYSCYINNYFDELPIISARFCCINSAAHSTTERGTHQRSNKKHAIQNLSTLCTVTLIFDQWLQQFCNVIYTNNMSTTHQKNYSVESHKTSNRGIITIRLPLQWNKHTCPQNLPVGAVVEAKDESCHATQKNKDHDDILVTWPHVQQNNGEQEQISTSEQRTTCTTPRTTAPNSDEHTQVESATLTNNSLYCTYQLWQTIKNKQEVPEKVPTAFQETYNKNKANTLTTETYTQTPSHKQ